MIKCSACGYMGPRVVTDECPHHEVTTDVLRDAASDIENDWPWYADAMRIMQEGLQSMAETQVGDLAREVLRRAVEAAQGGPTVGTISALTLRAN
jgi:hypothetical protein